MNLTLLNIAILLFLFMYQKILSKRFLLFTVFDKTKNINLGIIFKINKIDSIDNSYFYEGNLKSPIC